MLIDHLLSPWPTVRRSCRGKHTARSPPRTIRLHWPVMTGWP